MDSLLQVSLVLKVAVLMARLLGEMTLPGDEDEKDDASVMEFFCTTMTVLRAAGYPSSVTMFSGFILPSLLLLAVLQRAAVGRFVPLVCPELFSPAQEATAD